MDIEQFSRRLVAAHRLVDASPHEAAAMFDALRNEELPELKANGPNDSFVIDIEADDGSLINQPELKRSLLHLPASWRCFQSPGNPRPLLDQWALDAAFRGAAAAPQQLRRIAEEQLARRSPGPGFDVSLHLVALASLATSDDDARAVLEVWQAWAGVLRGDDLWPGHLSRVGEARPVLLVLIELAERFARAEPLYPYLYRGLKKAATGWFGGADAIACFSAIASKQAYLDATSELRAADEAEAEAKRRADEALQARVAEARGKAGAIIGNAGHPLVVGHLEALRAIAMELVSIDVVRGKKTKLEPLSDADLAAADEALGAPLPNNFKALLLAFGALKSPYFPKANLAPPKGAALKSAKKAWAVDVDALQPVLSDQGNATRWFTNEQALPAKASHTDGTMQIGYSVAQAPLHLVIRGPRAGEVWVDSLDNEAFDVFGPACAQPELLAFLQKSLVRADESWAHLMY